MTAKTIDPQHAADLADDEDGAISGPWVKVTATVYRTGRPS